MKKKTILGLLFGFLLIVTSTFSASAQNQFTKAKLDTTDYVFFRLTGAPTSKTSPYGWTISKDSLLALARTATAAKPIPDLYLSTGANKSTGTATLVSGTVTVSNTRVTANSTIIITRLTPGGTLGVDVMQGTIVAGTSFVINSVASNGTVNTSETSVVRWTIIN